MVLTHDGNLIHVCGYGKAKVDYSVFSAIWVKQKWTPPFSRLAKVEFSKREMG
jgi:hypothetical protein